jgi:polyisoprenoid-binding protein YceI
MPAAQSRAAAAIVKLAPRTTTIDLTIYLMGLFPLPAHFDRFTGTLSVDPADPAKCAVAMDIDAASLDMADRARQRLAVGPQLLDAAHYPTLHYAGSCAGGQPTGELTMHGTTRPLKLTAKRDGMRIVAQGSLRRQDYGVSGLPGLIGRTVRIRFDVQLPDGLAAMINR